MNTYIGFYKCDDIDLIRNMIDSSYTSKNKFASEMRANGCKVVAILTPDKVAEIQKDDEALSNNLNLSERLISYIKECMDEIEL